FRELCALAAIGQLSSDEDRELSQHLYECESCREANAAYAHVVQHQLPKADPIRRRFRDLLPKPAPNGELRERFLASARAAGVEFSPEVELARPPANKKPVWLGRGRQLGFAAAALLMVGLAGVVVFEKHGRPAESGRGEEPSLVREDGS